MTREEMLEAVAGSDAAYDGVFFYAVKSTGVYCRPSCTSRCPKPENTVFFDTREDAEAAGFRPCKRCRPDLAAYQPVGELAQEMKRVIDADFLEKASMFASLKRLGVSPKRAIEIFKAQFRLTPGEYADHLRMKEARRLLSETDEPILEIAYTLGFESVSAFYALFGKTMHTTPAQYRRNAAGAARLENAEVISFLYRTDFGDVTISADGSAVTGVRFGEPGLAQKRGQNGITELAASQLREYFAGKRRTFSVPLRPAGTPFQRMVWDSLLEIPFGQIRSYRQVAQSIGRPTASRAVGMANRRNPIAILIPCHRVVGVDGSLTGYAAGLPMKRRLLSLEQNI